MTAGQLRCGWCNKVIVRATWLGRPPKYCSKNHCNAAYAERRRQRAVLYAKRAPYSRTGSR